MKNIQKSMLICDHCGTVIDNTGNEILIVETTDIDVYFGIQRFKQDIQYHFCKKCYGELMDFINKARNEMK